LWDDTRYLQRLVDCILLSNGTSRGSFCVWRTRCKEFISLFTGESVARAKGDKLQCCARTECPQQQSSMKVIVSCLALIESKYTEGCGPAE